VTARLDYDVTGPEGAAAVVLGASMGTTRELWDPQLPALAERRRVIRFEHRGHAASEGPGGPYRIADLGADVLALLDGLQVDTFSYAGVSLGGMIGMWLAAHAPERVERLALCCTSAHLPPAQAWLDRAAAVRAGGTAVVADAVVARWFTARLGRERPDVVEHFRSTLRDQVGAEGYAGCCEAIAVMDLRADLAQVTATTLVIAGAEDPAAPPEHAREIAALIRAGGGTASVVVVDGGSHLATFERADLCTPLLVEHLGGSA
jgi:3-oxoadipate enol-lactonase